MKAMIAALLIPFSLIAVLAALLPALKPSMRHQ
jgi:hypothetical protein